MVRKKVQLEEKYHVSTLLENGGSVITVARDIGISGEARLHIVTWYLKILGSMTNCPG